MSQHYSNPKRETDPHTLPDIEVFYRPSAADGFTPYVLALAICEDCGSEVTEIAAQIEDTICIPCARERYPAGWYWWSCFPGCLPDGDPMGPFETEEDALADAREGIEE
jgi:hypothetical protein